MLQDNLQFQGRRERMVQQIELRCSLSVEVSRALRQVPRHLFVTEGLQHLAYEDRPLPIAAGQTISQPTTVAIQTQLLGCKKWDRVLEIGTGCGYQAAVLSAMGLRVYSIERVKELYTHAKSQLEALGYKALLSYGNGFDGLPQFAPFQGILIACGAPEVPQALIAQLAPGGRLVIPVGRGPVQEMRRITRLANGDCTSESFGTFQFVPMLNGTVS